MPDLAGCDSSIGRDQFVVLPYCEEIRLRCSIGGHKRNANRALLTQEGQYRVAEIVEIVLSASCGNTAPLRLLQMHGIVGPIRRAQLSHAEAIPLHHHGPQRRWADAGSTQRTYFQRWQKKRPAGPPNSVILAHQTSLFTSISLQPGKVSAPELAGDK